MRGDLTNGWVTLCGAFPPTLNTEDDPAALKPNESASCYGVDCTKAGYLKTGTCPEPVSMPSVLKTFGGYTWGWYYDRAWRFSGSSVYYNAPEYDNFRLAQGLGVFTADNTVVNLLPCMGERLWVCTRSGSHFLENLTDMRGWYELGKLQYDMYALYGDRCCVVGETPFVSNDRGIFSSDGRQSKEWTRAIRRSLGVFKEQPIFGDATRRYLIGRSATLNKFCVDLETGGLFDFGTEGFLFTSRTMVQRGFSPFEVKAVAFVFERDDTANARIDWETKLEDNAWTQRAPIVLDDGQGRKTRVEAAYDEGQRNGYKFQLRVTGLTDNLKIREIQVLALGLAEGSMTA